ncbi:MAG: 2-oxoacid:acceptor oxidoreductase family protein [Chlorobi bacterium]|nr:2-oxoacid:acceptor oxidoreductase family protein [Chlorobiota bacterium]
MYRIRFHGRGGQGMKTAGRILGTSFFLEGFDVQDAPRYGAERRGAPIFAYVRASRSVIQERGVIRRPSLVVVADDTLAGLPEADVLGGQSADTVMAILSDVPEGTWRSRLNLDSPIVCIPRPDAIKGYAGQAMAGVCCAAVAARLCGSIPKSTLARAVREELGFLAPSVLERSLSEASRMFDSLAPYEAVVRDRPDREFSCDNPPGWVELFHDAAAVAAPVIFGGLTSRLLKTGMWRTFRPVIDTARCRRCWWLCSSFCPDSAIHVGDDGIPAIDYEHCKGCLVCVARCPVHAISAVPESRGVRQENGEEAV